MPGRGGCAQRAGRVDSRVGSGAPQVGARGEGDTGADWHASQFGNLAIGEGLHLAQNNHLAKDRRQLGQRAFDIGPVASPDHDLLGGRPVRRHLQGSQITGGSVRNGSIE